ncbi:hypothetical protein [Reyranella sp.]
MTGRTRRSSKAKITITGIDTMDIATTMDITIRATAMFLDLSR